MASDTDQAIDLRRRSLARIHPAPTSSVHISLLFMFPAADLVARELPSSTLTGWIENGYTKMSFPLAARIKIGAPLRLGPSS